jgi:glycosyltransferase involved in cell wall biosynthesis
MTQDRHTDPVAIGVVIPARDEAARIDRCLTAVMASAGSLAHSCGARIGVRIVVVADACTDHTVHLLSRWSSVSTVVCTAGRVGAARAEGARHLLGWFAAEKMPLHRSWIANTDADSVVPTCWLTVHAAAARRGVDLLLGTVRPDPSEIDSRLERRWYARHQLSDGHQHVHGANLGVRADWYLAGGGFPTLESKEDVRLAAAVAAAGGAVERTGSAPVLTSSRLVGRAPSGLAEYLRGLVPPADDARADRGTHSEGTTAALA